MPQREVSAGAASGNKKMRNLVLTLACGAALSVAGCGTPPATNNGNANSTAATPVNQSSRASNTGLPPVSSAHGGDTPVTPPATSAAPNSAAKPGIDTAALDTKIERAEAKAKAKGATQDDKLAVAAAYLQRANVYRDAGQPMLYKFALGDYRRALRYQPDNEEARAKMEEIVSIYKSMNKPVPENGNEP
jgi:tetratricopeptide (TPR) repeat protein